MADNSAPSKKKNFKSMPEFECVLIPEAKSSSSKLSSDNEMVFDDPEEFDFVDEELNLKEEILEESEMYESYDEDPNTDYGEEVEEEESLIVEPPQKRSRSNLQDLPSDNKVHQETASSTSSSFTNSTATNFQAVREEVKAVRKEVTAADDDELMVIDAPTPPPVKKPIYIRLIPSTSRESPGQSQPPVIKLPSSSFGQFNKTPTILPGVLPASTASFSIGDRSYKLLPLNSAMLKTNIKAPPKNLTHLFKTTAATGIKEAINLKCLKCSETFQTFDLLISHNQNSHTTFTCTYCDKNFDKPQDLKEHMNEHMPVLSNISQSAIRSETNNMSSADSESSRLLSKHVQELEKKHDDPYACDMCDFSTREISSLQTHMLSHSKTAEKLPCRYCDLTFKTSYGLEIHTKNAHPIFPCRICKVIYKSEDQMLLHMRSNHSGNDEQPKPVQQKDVFNYYACSMCNKTFNDIDLYEIHIKHHLKGERPISPSDTVVLSSPSSSTDCEILSPTQFKKPSVFKLPKPAQRAPQNNIKKSMYTCKLCNLMGPKEAIQNHMLVHCKMEDSDNIQYCCGHCDFKCESKTEMDAHKSTHAVVIEKLACKQCSEEFVQDSDLKSHIALVHPDEPKHENNESEVNSTTQNSDDDLAEEESSKTAPAKLVDHYECNHCSKTFQTLRKVYNHGEKVHSDVLVEAPVSSNSSGPFKCDTCVGSFEKIKDFYNHKLRHRNMRCYPCRYCGYLLANPGCLYSHFSAVHREERKVDRKKKTKTTVPDNSSQSDTDDQPSYVAKYNYDEKTHKAILECLRMEELQKEAEKNIPTPTAEDMETDSVTKIVYTCNDCEVTKSSKLKLKRHIKKMHLQKDPVPASPTSLTDAPYFSSVEQDYGIKIDSVVSLAESDFDIPVQESNTSANEVAVVDEKDDELILGDILHDMCKDNSIHYYCNKCEIHFINFNELYKHADENHKDSNITYKRKKQYFGKKFACDECAHIYDHKCHLLYHKIFHRNLEPFMCSLCDKTFQYLSSAIEHHKVTHNMKNVESNTAKFQCSECQFKFDSKTNFKQHLLLQHSIQLTYQCKFCSDIFSSVKKRNEHIDVKHWEENLNELDVSTPSATLTEPKAPSASELKQAEFFVPKSEFQYTCSVCTAKLDSLELLFQHGECIHRCIRLPVPVPPKKKGKKSVGDHECDECSYKFAKIQELYIHKLLHRNMKPYMCVRCGSMYRSKNALYGHTKAAHPNQEVKPVKINFFKCSVCNMSFDDLLSVYLHSEEFHKQTFVKIKLTKHTGGPIQCIRKSCKFTFKNETQFMEHMLKHRNVKPYVCTYCNNVFTDSRTIMYHRYYSHRDEHKMNKLFAKSSMNDGNTTDYNVSQPSTSAQTYSRRAAQLDETFVTTENDSATSTAELADDETDGSETSFKIPMRQNKRSVLVNCQHCGYKYYRKNVSVDNDAIINCKYCGSLFSGSKQKRFTKTAPRKLGAKKQQTETEAQMVFRQIKPIESERVSTIQNLISESESESISVPSGSIPNLLKNDVSISSSPIKEVDNAGSSGIAEKQETQLNSVLLPAQESIERVMTEKKPQKRSRTLSTTTECSSDQSDLQMIDSLVRKRIVSMECQGCGYTFQRQAVIQENCKTPPCKFCGCVVTCVAQPAKSKKSVSNGPKSNKKNTKFAKHGGKSSDVDSSETNLDSSLSANETWSQESSKRLRDGASTFHESGSMFNDYTLECNLCNLTFASIDLVYHHGDEKHRDNFIEIKHNKIDSGHLKCDECTCTFEKLLDYQHHKLKHRNIKCYACKYCSTNLTTKMSQIMHYSRSHKNKPNKSLLDAEQSKQESDVCDTKDGEISATSNSSEKMFACDKCDVIRETEEGLLHHKKFHLAFDYLCKKCKKTFDGLLALQYHKCTTEVHSCERCDETFTEAKLLTEHVERHHPVSTPEVIPSQPETTPAPEIVMKETVYSIVHDEVDRGSRIVVYSCQECFELFPDIPTLSDHMLQHTNCPIVTPSSTFIIEPVSDDCSAPQPKSIETTEPNVSSENITVKPELLMAPKTCEVQKKKKNTIKKFSCKTCGKSFSKQGLKSKHLCEPKTKVTVVNEQLESSLKNCEISATNVSSSSVQEHDSPSSTSIIKEVKNLEISSSTSPLAAPVTDGLCGITNNFYPAMESIETQNMSESLNIVEELSEEVILTTGDVIDLASVPKQHIEPTELLTQDNATFNLAQNNTDLQNLNANFVPSQSSEIKTSNFADLSAEADAVSSVQDNSRAVESEEVGKQGQVMESPVSSTPATSLINVDITNQDKRDEDPVSETRAPENHSSASASEFFSNQDNEEFCGRPPELTNEFQQVEKNAPSEVPSPDSSTMQMAPEKIFTCKKCGESFLKQGLMVKHTYIHRKPKGKIKVNKKDDVSHPCNESNKQLANIDSLKSHMVLHDTKETTCDNTNETVSRLEVSTTASFCCCQCSEKFSKRDELTSHVNEKHRKNFFKCMECGFTLSSERQLDLHVSLKHKKSTRAPKNAQCDLCDKKFVNMQGVEKHKANMHSTKNQYFTSGR